MHSSGEELEEYLKKNFPIDSSSPDTSVRHQALKYAYEMRHVVDDGYWKRATYFWTLIAAVFVGYYTVFSVSDSDRFFISCLLSSFGVVLSYAWLLVNRASRFWLHNWERHIDALEDAITGPLYKSVCQYKDKNILAPYQFSIFHINAFISLYASFLWGIIWLHTLFLMPTVKISYEGKYVSLILFGLGTVLCLCYLRNKCKTDLTTEHVLELSPRKITKIFLKPADRAE